MKKIPGLVLPVRVLLDLILPGCGLGSNPMMPEVGPSPPMDRISEDVTLPEPSD